MPIFEHATDPSSPRRHLRQPYVHVRQKAFGLNTLISLSDAGLEPSSDVVVLSTFEADREANGGKSAPRSLVKRTAVRNSGKPVRVTNETYLPMRRNRRAIEDESPSLPLAKIRLSTSNENPA